MRPITVDGKEFRWRFDENLVVISKNRSSPQLYVDWGWQDWLEPEGPGNEPHIVTPSFVERAIAFALNTGWQPEVNGPPTKLTFEDDTFARVQETI